MRITSRGYVSKTMRKKSWFIRCVSVAVTKDLEKGEAIWPCVASVLVVLSKVRDLLLHQLSNSNQRQDMG